MSRWFAMAALLALCAGCSDAPGGDGARGDGRGRVMVLGFDGMDHGLVSEMIRAGQLPTFARLARQGGFRKLRTTTPPQSPVAWASFITGAGAGHHGIFDFVHRDPDTRAPYLSTSRTEDPSRIELGPLAIPLGSGAVTLLRQGKPFWWHLSRAGVEATVIKIPSHFPPRDDGDARVLSGMGTPDLLGTYGTFTVLTTDSTLVGRELAGGRVAALEPGAGGALRGALTGPADPLSSAGTPLSLDVEVAVDRSRRGALVTVGSRRVLLGRGEWSGFIPLSFDVAGGLSALSAEVRLYLQRVDPVVLYVSPLNIDPRDPALPISSPDDFAAHLSRAGGRFYTQGMAEDTKALASGLFSVDEFLDQARLVLAQRRRLLEVAMDEFERGFLFFYFSSTDQITHMMFRAHDRSHPARTAADEPHADVIRTIYREMDRVLAWTLERLRPADTLFVMSDHGFGPAGYQFDLNRWLLQQGYLALDEQGAIDWSRTQAYGMGLNGLYINQRGRERGGTVPATRRDALLSRLTRGLRRVRHPDTGARVVTHVARSDRIYRGPMMHLAPDLIVGYGRGIKVSDLSAQGGVGPRLFQINRSAWSGDHCGDRRHVPGILFSNRKLRPGAHDLVDLPATILGLYDIERPDHYEGHDLLASSSDER